MQEEMYGFTKQENIEQAGILRCCRYGKEEFVAAEISEKLSGPLSGQLMEASLSEEMMESYYMYLQKMDCHFLLFVWREQEEERLFFFSDTKRVRALEFLDYLIPEFGLVKGDARYAGGRISSAILKVQMSGMDIDNTFEYLLKKSSSYFEDCLRIEAERYGRDYAEEICRMQRYVKKRIPWAYVSSTDIVEEGKQFRIKSLENESGITLTADKEKYIMIGCRGEIYDMHQTKFQRTYETTEENLDVFEQMLDFLPEAERIPEGDYISLDEMAHLCYPKQEAGIYAQELKKRTKVFPAGESEEYYLGRPGDYLAVRPEDFSDIYIIQKDIFLQTYEEED